VLVKTLIVIEMENFSYEEPNCVFMVRVLGKSSRVLVREQRPSQFERLGFTLCAKYRHIGLKCVQGCTPLFNPFFPPGVIRNSGLEKKKRRLKACMGYHGPYLLAQSIFFSYIGNGP
jgi:hypothetical protein